MRVIIDKNIVIKTKEGIKNSSLEELVKADADITFDWPALLEFLGIDLAKMFSPFTSEDNLYREVIIALESKPHVEHLEHLFDQIFVDCLNWVRSKEEIHPNYLLNEIRKLNANTVQPLFSKTLRDYERLLFEESYLSVHDLTLYLAWDRVCVNLAIIFEYPSTAENVKEGLRVLRDCLIESFQHITTQKETHPGFFRLIEALYAFQMREEYLQTYSDPEWQTLCESSQVLRFRDEFLSVPYIDQAIFNTQQNEHLPALVKVLTLDSWDKVSKSLKLARYIIDKLKNENHNWKYDIHTIETNSLSF